MKPPVPITAPFENRRIPESRASAVVVMTWSRVTSYFARRSGIDPHLRHLDPLAPDGHVGHAGDPEQPSPDRPVGDHRHVPSEIVSEDRPTSITRPVVETGGIITGGLAQVGSVRTTDAIRSCDELPRLQDVRPRTEEQLDRRELRHRLRTDRVEPGDPVQRLLERDRDEGLDLGGRQPQAGGLDLDTGRCELREDVDRHGLELANAEEHHRAAPTRRRDSGTSGST